MISFRPTKIEASDHSANLHGWGSGWSVTSPSARLSQQLTYADGLTPSYTGRISSRTALWGDQSRCYNYTYDKLGRLSTANYTGKNKSSALPDDYSTSYTYDLQGNILTLKRNGLIAPGLFGQIDDLTATFDGNQLATLRDNAANVLLESSLDIQ